MIGIVFANLWRRPGRTLFTALGIAIGVATVVALLSLGDGLKRTAGGLVHLGDADFVVYQHGVADPTASFLPSGLQRRIEAVPGVQSAAPILMLVEKVKADPSAIVFGTPPDSSIQRRLVVLQGRRATAPGEIAIGDRLAGEMHAKVGQTVRVGSARLRVVGIYHGGQFFVDAGAVMDLGQAQRIIQRTGEITALAVQVAAGAHTDAVRRAIARRVSGVDQLANPEEAARAGANGQLVHKTVLLLVAVALIIGSIGVTDTMAMAVLERSRELALMSAVGWSPVLVSAAVLAEGVAVSVLGAGIGLLLGAIGAQGLSDAMGVANVVSPHVTPWSMGRALLIGVLIGVFGGLYPAWRVSRLPADDLLARA
ncbi:MAG TPA: ABC transporter permease [Solirubrobacteraceae bacterium]|nr:ABC transporter permease [Solirubrobacteraceae bacterium]